MLGRANRNGASCAWGPSSEVDLAGGALSPRARRTSPEGASSPRARWTSPEGASSPRARWTSPEGVFSLAALAGRGSHQGRDRVVCVFWLRRLVCVFSFFTKLGGFSPVI
jgi:hypothetical protein